MVKVRDASGGKGPGTPDASAAPAAPPTSMTPSTPAAPDHPWPAGGLTTVWQAAGRLPEGPLDLVGDIHGEIDALGLLLGHLGYGPDGAPGRGRRLVFLGDLIDRGPDSPAVVRWVADLVDRGRAVAVMGNHDLNAVARRPKAENTWLFGHGHVSGAERRVVSERERDEIIGLLEAFPIAMERADLRVVHACWDEGAIRGLEGATGPAAALADHRDRIKARLTGETDRVAVKLALQNENPMKLLTSGPEVRAAEAFFAGGKMRNEARHPWWDEYADDKVLVFGHYWRITVPDLQKDDGLFSRQPLNSTLGRGRAICIDYSVGGRAIERRRGRPHGPYIGRLAALRWPERELVFDDGERLPVLAPNSAATGAGA